MPILGINQPDMLNADSDLRLRRLDLGEKDALARALAWYQDEETLLLVDGKADPYDDAHLRQMYAWLEARGELWWIEVRDGGVWRAVGDVCLWPDDLPIVVGERSLRGRHVGRRVVGALVGRARALGWSELLVDEIYDWNVGSQRCFEACGFVPYAKTERGHRYRLRLSGDSVCLCPD